MPLLPPPYFDEVKRRTADLWQLLESRPEIKGAWQQLFRQVQSPRHVFSELLQNADDSGAANVAVRIKDGWFEFEHDGRDFSETEFSSLCQFGFSNKRNLHTIGFRGIGFKSTFSVGVAVEVRSPTLAVRFHKDRFTDPVWIANADPCKNTRIRINLHPPECRAELERSLKQWQDSCSSLLFFQHLRRLVIEDHRIEREVIGPGPVTNSQWMKLSSRPNDKLLVIRSAVEDFPPEAAQEVREERNARDFSLPPCSVDVVLGLHGDEQLFVVLPTGVRPRLPFSGNAPFVQDPSRHGIKSPSLSPTNRWLLTRIGKLAGQSLLAWVGNSKLEMSLRALAYGLLPAPATSADATMESLVTEVVTTAFINEVRNKSAVLIDDGAVVGAGVSISVPRGLQKEWSRQELTTAFGSADDRIVALDVPDRVRKLLDSWKLARLLATDEIINSCKRQQIKRPSNAAIAALWSVLESECRFPRNTKTRRELGIVPIAGQTILGPAAEVVRLSDRATLTNQGDWSFLTNLVHVVDGAWLKYLASEQGQSDENVIAAKSLLQLIELSTPTPISRVINEAARKLFVSQPSLAEGIRLAQIAAVLDADMSSEFGYFTQDGRCRSIDQGLVVDPTAAIETLVPAAWAEKHILHENYLLPSETCRRDQWTTWLRSSKSGVGFFPRLQEIAHDLSPGAQLSNFLKKRQFTLPADFQLGASQARVEDFDFEADLVRHWQSQETKSPTVWQELVELILQSPLHLWRESMFATLYGKSRGGILRKANCDLFASAWVQRLAGKRCLPDTRGELHEPAQLLMRTPDTEPLMGVESFIKAELDTPHARPLLKLLGVRDTPSGPQQILGRLQSLSTVARPPLQEVVKWYGALDRILARGKTEEIAQARQAFQDHPLVLTQELDWVAASQAFLNVDEQGLPGVAVVHEAAREFAMWTKLGVEPRPTLERLLAWLTSLPSGGKLEAGDLKRVKLILAKFPQQIWDQCRHWVTLEGTWEPTESLNYRLSMQGLTQYAKLFPNFKQQTADLRGLSAATCEQSPFSVLQALDQAIEYRVTDRRSLSRRTEVLPWLEALGNLLARVVLEDEALSTRVRSLGSRLATTTWQTVSVLKVSPHIAGTPAGEPESTDVLWHDQVLFVQDRPFSRIFNAIVHEISRPFAASHITEAIRACVARDESFILDYFEESFILLDPVERAPERANEAKSVPKAASFEPLIVPADTPQNVDNANPEGKIASPEVEAQPADPNQPEGSDPPAPPLRSPRPNKLSLFERFAAALGFKPDHQGTYFHESGDWLARRPAGFNCERISPTGDTVCQYWISDQCLLNGGVEINADLWEVLKQQANHSAAVFTDLKGQPVLIPGTELVRQVTAGVIRIFPAKYRLKQAD